MLFDTQLQFIYLPLDGDNSRWGTLRMNIQLLLLLHGIT